MAVKQLCTPNLLVISFLDEVETVKQVKAVVIPTPIAVEQVGPKEVVTQVTAVGAGVTDLVKQVKRLESKLNLVLERLIARKREISGELDGFEGGVDSVLNLLSPAMTVVEESKPAKKTTLITQDDDSDDDAGDEDEPPPKKTVIITGDRKRRQGSPKRRKREITVENIKRLAKNPKSLKSGLRLHERSPGSSHSKIHDRQKRDSIRRKRFSKHVGNKKGVEARYHLNLDSPQPVLIEETGPGWPVRARRRAGGASVEVIAHSPTAARLTGKDPRSLLLERAQREALHESLHGRGRKRTDDEDPAPELDVGKRDTTIVEETSDIDGPGNFAEETVSEEKVISDDNGSETKIVEEQSEQDTDEEVKEKIVEETDTTNNAGSKTSIVEEVDNVEEVDGDEKEESVVIEEEDDDGDDDDDDDDRPRLDSALSEDGGDDAIGEDTNGPVMADGSPV